ncbi:MAG: 3-deoxy-D-manno-octulosonic acid transferase [Sedimentisphaerales bacterium]|nr:3-deoxy-D-manno-octulosonic acid transferase [Sedimentisphaerales bacterium]
MRIIIDILYLLAVVVVAPVALYRLIRHNRYRAGWAQRLGRISRRNPAKKCLWLHAVSVGEVNAATTVLDELERRFGDYEIVVSTTTDTGFARATAVFGDRFDVFYFPFDFSWIMSRAFGNIRPNLCLLMELEVWPNFVRIAKRLGVPVVVVNGRISDRSFRSYSRIRPLIKTVFSKVTLALAQTDEYARRFTRLGCKNVIVSGSLKYDTAQTQDKVEGADVVAKELGIADERLWVLGGTGNDEEALLLDVYQQLKHDGRFADLRLVVVPRKPERFDEVAQLIQNRGLNLIRYSRLKESVEDESIINYQLSIDTVILGDTMGDLRKFYSLATIIFVGRSLVPMGGSDMMEAAALGKCTIFGPHAFNFKQTVDALLADKGAIMVRDKDDLLKAMKKCLTDPGYAQNIAQNGRRVIIKNQGATQKTSQEITKILNSAL